jgi:ABC-type transport system involved in multi-copper enzyme maturation permease subunit|tara:strand:+ start:2903 stop:3808 length:906 start_codon:yes stop_codon:yes gene_type:complete
MEIKEILNRSKNLGRPIIKDCIHRLLINKLTWILILILVLPAILGLWAYTNERDERQVKEINGEKIYHYDANTENDLVGLPIHENVRENFIEISDIFLIKFIGVLMAIMFASELINEEFNKKTIQILRTTPIRPLEIIFYRYIAGVICMFSILAITSLIYYLIVMMNAGLYGIKEELDVLFLVIKLLLLESIAYIGIFILISVYFDRPFFLGIIYWMLWEMIVSGGNYQQITVSHYLNSILFKGLENMKWDVSTEGYGLIKTAGNDTVDLVTEPFTAAIIVAVLALLTIWISAKGLEKRQF